MNSILQSVNKLREWIGHPFAHDVATLQVGSVISRIIAFATSLIFARILGPEGYGFYSLVFALAGVVLIFHDFGAAQGTINLFSKAHAEKNEPEKHHLLSFLFKILLLSFFTKGLISVIISPFLGQWFYDDLYLGQLASIVVAIGSLSMFITLLQIILQTLREIRSLMIYETIHKFLNGAIPIVLVILGYEVLGIVVGQFASMTIMSIVAIAYYARIRDKYALPKFFTLLKTKLSWAKIKYYFSFGIQIAIAKNIVKLNEILPLLILGSILPTNSGLGFYKIAFTYISLPLFLLAPVSRLLNVQLPQTEAYGRAQLFRRFWQVTGLSLGIATVLTIGAILVGPYLIKFFYGEEFIPSIAIMYALAVYPLVSSVGVGLGALFRTLHKMKIAITITVGNLILLVPSAYLLINNFAIKGLVAVTILFTILPNAASLLYILRLSKKFKEQG